MSKEKYTVGVDFGTLSGRALVVRVSDGHEMASAEHVYTHAVVSDTLPGGTDRLPPQWALQVPSDYVDVQISLDGATAEVNDAVRGPGSFAMAVRALENLKEAGFKDAKISVVVTRHNIDQLDGFKALADNYGATLRITRLRPSGRGACAGAEVCRSPAT